MPLNIFIISAPLDHYRSKDYLSQAYSQPATLLDIFVKSAPLNHCHNEGCNNVVFSILNVTICIFLCRVFFNSGINNL